MNAPPLPEIASLWQDTATRHPRYDALATDAQCDVAIVGGGYTGLSAALHIAEAGLAPVVLEASRVGWGASGRNGGVVSAKFRVSYADVAARHGLPMAQRMAALAHESVALVAELVERHGLHDAGFRMSGNLKCAHNPVAFAKLQAERDWYASQLNDGALRLLDADEVAEETGSRDFTGGLLNPHGGLIHPLNFARGLAEAAAARGIAIHEQTPVQGLRRDGAHVVLHLRTGAKLRARQVVFATNAYADLTTATGPMPRTLIPFRSAMIATGPLDPAHFGGILKTGRSYTETRRMMRWFRPVGDRVLFGGRGAFGKADSPATFAALHRALLGIFPQLREVPITHRWSGLVAMTLDSVPHVGRLDPQVSYALGYNGAGVAMSVLMGRYLARVVQGETPELGLLWNPRVRQVPFYAIREPAVRAVAGWYQFLDAIGR